MSKRICIVAASEFTLKAFMMDHLRALGERYELTVVVNTTEHGFLLAKGIKARLVPVAIKREIAPSRDFLALLRLLCLFWRGRFDLVHSLTPKAGLLALMAGFLARVPVRLHVFTGQVWVTRKGFARWSLKAIDRLMAFLATNILVDGLSQRDFLVSEGVLRPGQGVLLGPCSSLSGVDLERFKPEARVRVEVRGELGIPEGVTVFTFLGRLNRDKGILELAQAFRALSAQHGEAWLLVVGPDEEGLVPKLHETIGTAMCKVRIMPYTNSPERYLAASDILCLPSHREGLGKVVVEAGAVGVPSICTRIYGLSDVVREGRTGLLVPVRDPEALRAAMQELLLDTGLRKALAEGARQRAVSEFSSQRLVVEMLAYYRVLFREAGP